MRDMRNLANMYRWQAWLVLTVLFSCGFLFLWAQSAVAQDALCLISDASLHYKFSQTRTSCCKFCVIAFWWHLQSIWVYNQFLFCICIIISINVPFGWGNNHHGRYLTVSVLLVISVLQITLFMPIRALEFHSHDLIESYCTDWFLYD